MSEALRPFLGFCNECPCQMFNSDGSYYVSGGPFQVAALQNLQPSQPLPVGVKHVNAALLASDCRAIASKKDFIYNADRTWRLKYRVSIFDGPFAGPGNAKAITKSYRKKNGRWRKHISWVAAQVYGNVVAGDCTGGTNVQGAYESKRRKKVKSKVSVTGAKAISGGISSYHWHEKVGSLTASLTW